jgi:hypothetical protein
VKLAPSASLAALARIADSGNPLSGHGVPKTLMDSPEKIESDQGGPSAVLRVPKAMKTRTPTANQTRG